MAKNFGVSPSTFSEGLNRARQERERINNQPDPAPSAPQFAPQLPVPGANKMSQPLPAPTPQKNDKSEADMNMIDGLNRFTNAITDLKLLLDNQPRTLSGAVTESARSASTAITESIVDAAANAVDEIENSRSKSTAARTVLAAAVTAIVLATGYALGTKSIYYVSNQQAAHEADRWRDFSAAYQYSTPEERKAVASFYSRYRGNTANK